MEAEMEGWMWQRDGREWRSWCMNEKKRHVKRNSWEKALCSPL
jgi:hypothetical protein